MSEFRYTDADGDSIQVFTSADHIQVSIDARHDEVHVLKEQAPALALAILEAAGYEADTAGGQVNDAAYLLRAAIHQQAEDKERKALDAEAKELYEAFHEGGPFAPWEELDPRGVQRFRQATTRARKLHAAKEAAK